MQHLSPINAAQPGLRVIFCLSFFREAPPDEVAAFKKCLIECDHVLHSIELSGSFDFILEAGLQDLKEYQARLDAMSAPLHRLVARRETSFVCSRVHKQREPSRQYARCFWVPCKEGHQRVEAAHIEKITAEGDYMRLHIREGSHLIHCTIRSLVEQLDPNLFVHLNRSVLVRTDLIERVVHEKRRWVVRLADGSLQPISRTHRNEVLRLILGREQSGGAPGKPDPVV
jgi:DNA-binding LytR/AlgR family response regulator